MRRGSGGSGEPGVRGSVCGIFAGPFALDPATFFHAPGAWNGVLGVSFSGGPGLGIDQVDLQLHVQFLNLPAPPTPEPATAALGALGLAGAALATLRRGLSPRSLRSGD